VHIMHPTVREFYNLEEVWGGKSVKLKPPAPAKKPAAKTPVPKKKKPARAKAARPRRKR